MEPPTERIGFGKLGGLQFDSKNGPLEQQLPLRRQ